MKIILLHTGELKGPDLRLARLAEFLGAPFEALRLPNRSAGHEAYLENAIPDRSTCLVVNPTVLREWLGSDRHPAELSAFLLSRFERIIVHGLRPDPFHSELAASLSRGGVDFAGPITGTSALYEIAKNSTDICGPFAGLSFGPANRGNDCVLSLGTRSAEVRALISIEGRPFVAAVKHEKTEVLFIGSEETADVDTPVGEVPLAEYFSRLVPQAMALRYAAGEECWRPGKAHASIIIDDPLLRKSYGFLNFESLLALATRHNFHASIAFIPHNFRRNSPRITRMFHENPDRLSICFHGNDHTASEFASRDTAFLNALLWVAEGRMASHEKTTGIPCDKVMVFPQGIFSSESMKVLQAHNFFAAVNTDAHPEGEPARLTLRELAQPAILAYGQFPLFIRKPSRKTQSQDVAFNIFFGKPVLFGEHHDIFQHPESLAEVAAKINMAAPDVRWTNLAAVASNSTLTRRAPDGSRQVRAYSGTVRVSNASRTTERYSIEWKNSCDGDLVEKVLADGKPWPNFEADQRGVRLSAELGPGETREFSAVHRNDYPWLQSLGIKWNTQAFVRRRLSEFRDNYLSKNENVLKAAKAFQKRMLKI